MDPLIIPALSALILRLLDWSKSRGFVPTAEDIENIRRARKALLADWDSLAPGATNSGTSDDDGG